MTSLCLLFLAFLFLGIRIFFRNVTESLVEVERYNSNTQTVFTWTGGVSIVGAIQNLIVCVKMAWSELKRLRRRIFVKYAHVEISDLRLFSSRDVCKNEGYRIIGRDIGQKQHHLVNNCILFEITRMKSVNPRIAALFYASVMKVLKVRPVVRRKKMISSSALRGTTTISSLSARRI